MDDNRNTLAGWILAGGIAILGLSIVSGKYFHGERPEKMGYPIEGVVAEGGAADSGPPLATLLQTADVAKGEATFKKCASCHTITQGGANGIGPNLYATMGEAVGQGKGGYPFSDALKGVGGSWDFDKMNAWLTSPRKFAPGTKMSFAGLGDPVERANIIAYLNAQGSNLPLPAAPAAAPAADPKAAKGDTTGADAAATGSNAAAATPGAVGAAGPEADKEGVAVKQAAPNNN